MRNCCDMPFSGTLWPFCHHTIWPAALCLCSPSLAHCLPVLKKPQLLLFAIYKEHSVFKGAQLCEMPDWFYQPGPASQTQKIIFLQHQIHQILKAMAKWSPLWPKEPIYEVHWGRRGQSGSDLYIEMTELFINFKRKNAGFHKSSETTFTGN